MATKTTQSWKIDERGCLYLLPSIPDNSIDMILTDLPYGSTACAWDTQIDLEKLWPEYKRIIKDNGAIVLTASQPFTSKLVMSNFEMFKYSLVWEKTRSTDFMNAKNKICSRHEDILIFSKGVTANGGKTMMKFNPQMEIGIPYKKFQKTDPRVHTQGNRKKTMAGLVCNNDGIRYPNSVLKYGNPNNNTVHPTQKPVALFEYLIKTYTNEGDMVHDSCLGSGTTLEACLNTNRNCIGFEISDEWEHHYKERLKSNNAKLTDNWVFE